MHPAPTLQARLERQVEGDRLVVRVAGRLRLGDGPWLLREVRRAVAGGPPPVVFDLSGLERAEGGALALLVEARRELLASGRPVQLLGARPALAPVVALFDVPAAPPPGAPRLLGLVEQVGAATRGLLREARETLAFVGASLRATAAAARAPRTVPWAELPGLVVAAGTDALFIVLTINALVGLILGFQAASQLHRFGADIYMADLVGLSVVRELGPIMTAIIVCGRSGAAYAATLAAMKVGEEIDALTVLGFDPLRFLVLPRTLALLVAVPILTLLGDVVAVAGGLAVGVAALDLTPTAYLTETRAAILSWDIGQGLLKSVVFAATIALVACQQGLAATGGAEGVGRRTTKAVVATILQLIAIDAAFTALFYAWDL